MGAHRRQKRSVMIRVTLAATLLLATPTVVDAMTSAESEALFRLRYDALISEQNLAPRLYEPHEVAKGASDVRALPRLAAGERTIAAAAIESLDRYAAISNTEALIVARNGQIEYEFYAPGIASEMLVISRSMHKMIVALLIGRAIKDGHIEGLRQSASDFITEWRGTPKAAITIEDLLRMQSGLDWYWQNSDPNSLFQRAYLDPYSEGWIIERWPLVVPPGTTYDYANINSELLGLIVQRATGLRYAAYLSRALLQPAGAGDARVWINREGGAPKSGCCLLLSPEGFLRVGLWLIEQQRRPTLLPDWWFQEYLKPSPHKPEFGLGVWLGKPYSERRLIARAERPQAGVYHSAPYLAEDLYLFDGADARLMYIVPSLNLVILRTGGPPPKDGPPWDNALLPNTVIQGLPPLK